MNTLRLSLLSLFVSSLMAVSVHAEEHVSHAAPDNGTDPTRVSRSAQVTFEHLGLPDGLASDTFKFNYTMALGERQNYSLRLRVPVARMKGIGDQQSFALGDASLMLGHVFGLDRQGGYVAQGELIGNTASRTELGTGKTVLKLTLIAARFLADGAIFAPAFLQTTGFAGDKDRARVSSSTLDFYYVPKLSDPHNLLTLDPSLNYDWVSGKRFAGLAVTWGRIIGKTFGGNAIVTLKPSYVYGGEGIFSGERSGTWGLELGYKVIGF